MVKQSTLPPGVEVRGKRIRIRFVWNGKRYHEPYPFPASPQNIKQAGRLYCELKQKIDLGIFTLDDFRTHFPDSPYAEQLGTGSLFGELAQSWLDGVEVSPNTRTEYRKVLNKYWMPAIATKAIDMIRYSELRALVNGIEWSSAKTRNNALIPLRGIFEMAYEDDLIDRNPADKLKNQKHQKDPPDPFTRDEAEVIIQALYDQYQDLESIHAAYFEFAFFSGMRTSEMLALTWNDVDFRQGYVRVSKAQSKGKLNDKTKTAKVRDVRLNERSLHALQICKRLTFLAGKSVFASWRTGESFKTEKSQRFVFTRVLKKLGIRHRPAYNTRHTYATLLLMSGANPAFVAAQLGHSVTMTLNVYSKWIGGEADQAELAKVDFARVAQTWPKVDVSR